jgi:PAS domain S-box-containing protein
MEASPPITQLQERISRLEQELDAARARVCELEQNRHTHSAGHISQAEEALRTSEERLRFVVEQSPDNIFIQDRDLRYVWVSKPAHPLTIEEYLGRTDYDLLPFEEAQQLTELKTRVLNDGQTVSAEIPLHVKGEDRIFHAIYKPWLDGQGCVAGLAGYVRDITERSQAEEALRLSRDTLQAVLDAAPAGIVVADAAGSISFASAETQRILGGPVTGDAHGPEGGYLLCMPDGTPIAPGELPLPQALTGHAVTEREILVKRADGSHIFILASATPLRTAAGQPQGAITVFQDITYFKRAAEELKHAKAAAEEATRAKSEFLAKMSHEIRTPMTVFMAAIEHLLQIDRNPERRHLLGMAEQSAQRLRSLIDDILDIARIEARKVELEEKPFDLRASVRAAIDLFSLPAREKNLRLEMEVDDDAPRTVVGDPDRIGQVLINLIGNAVKFTHQGEVRVCVRPRGDFLEFAVADTGIGIPEEKHGILFQSFSQIDNAVSSRFGGTGLGLAISKGLVELMGGEISVRSRTAEGSVFTFAVPLSVAENHATSPAEAPTGDVEVHSTARILLAEDEPMIREMITMMLAQRGVRPDTAESGRQAVEKWQAGDFDLVFMDLQMPGMDGMEATRAIREMEQGRKRPCIIGLTGHASPEVREECLGAGMDQVLTKPVKVKDLLSAVDTCL